MKKQIHDGVWPTMLTPFTDKNEVDYDAIERLIEWYIDHHVDGIFAVCQSSEMFQLSLDERLKIARFTVEKAAGRVQVIASGHIESGFEDQIKEINLMSETGVEAVVLITNRLARKDESDDVFFENLQRVISKVPEEVPLGFYECPYPYKRVLSPQLLKRCAETRRFYFLKDTSCDIDNIKGKLEAVKGYGLKLFNANSATLLDSLKLGASGYSGVMANFHPELYAWLVRNWRERPDEAEELSDFLSLASQIERQLYPVNAKYYLMLEGVIDNYGTRSVDYARLTATNRLEVEQMRRITKRFDDKFKI